MGKRKELPIDKIINLYTNDKLSVRRIATTFRVCGETIARRLDENDIPIRGRCQTGENNSKWNGGKRITKEGYIQIYNPTHPNVKHSYVMEHRLVMEKKLGRLLEPWEKIHHKNGIKNDNRVENLEIVSAKNHYGQVECPHCHGEFLIQ